MTAPIEELTAQTELGHHGQQRIVRDARATIQTLKPILQNDQALRENRLLYHQHLVKLLEAYLTVLTLDGFERGEIRQDELGREHRVGDLVEHRPEHGCGVFGCDRHEASPSLGSDGSPSVGDGGGAARASGSEPRPRNPEMSIAAVCAHIDRIQQEKADTLAALAAERAAHDWEIRS